MKLWVMMDVATTTKNGPSIRTSTITGELLVVGLLRTTPNVPVGRSQKNSKLHARLTEKNGRGWARLRNRIQKKNLNEFRTLLLLIFFSEPVANGQAFDGTHFYPSHLTDFCVLWYPKRNKDTMNCFYVLSQLTLCILRYQQSHIIIIRACQDNL